MRYSSPLKTRPRKGSGVAAGTLRTAPGAALPQAAEAHIISTRTFEARAQSAAPSSIFERAGRAALSATPSLYPDGLLHETTARAWSDIDDDAHVDRRAPPGRNPGGRGQREPDRGI